MSDTDVLLKKLAGGDTRAADALLGMHRERLKRMVSCRMDPRLAARVSPSDVVQETMMTAAKDLSDYAKTRPMPFYTWLRRLAWSRLMDLQRRHLYRRKRAVGREEQTPPMTDQSLYELAKRLVGHGPSPSRAAQTRETRERLRVALDELEPVQREVLLLRYVEDMTLAEVASMLEISVEAAKMRQLARVAKAPEGVGGFGRVIRTMTTELLQRQAIAAAAPVREREKELAELIERMTNELKENGAVDLARWQARFPGLASEIESLAPMLEALEEFTRADPVVGAPDDAENQYKTLGDFRLVRELGRGGMGIVYEAEQLSLNRRVALKILPTAAVLDPRTLQRFKNEAQAAAALDHPHIVDVYGVGCERGVHYYAMRLIDGCTLADAICELQLSRRHGRGQESKTGNHESENAGQLKSASTAQQALISTLRTANRSGYHRLVAKLGMHVAEGLDHAHAQGVIHRDIKPSNLMLDGQGNVWITDFGLARIEANQTLTFSGDLLGTLRYMSPEQALASRAPVDHRTDIYSLGATLYELLTLQPVFDESQRAILLSKIALSNPTPPRQLNVDLPVDLETIVLKMLEKDPGSRYQTAADLAADLSRFVENKPITARRPTWLNRLAKWSSRNKPLVAVIDAALLMVSITAGGILGWWGRDSAARRMAMERIANEVFASAEAFAGQKKWPEALIELRRAEAAMSQPGLSELRERIGTRRSDVEMVLRLEDVRLNTSAIIGGEFDHTAADAAYGKAFSDYGIVALSLPPRKLADLVRHSAIREELGAALTDWSVVRLLLGGEGDRHRLPLLFAAKLADPDEWRDRLRQRWKREELVDMARNAPLETMSARTLSMFIVACTVTRANDQQMQQTVRLIQRKHASDFWVNQAAAHFFANTEPAQFDDAVRFYAIGIGLKPDAPAAHNNLGAALYKQGRQEEAIAEIRRAIELAPHFAPATANLRKMMPDIDQDARAH